MGTPLLSIENLRTEIQVRTTTRAVDGISLQVERGKTFALLGESGCGKSMTALSIMGLLPPGGHIVSGSVMLGGEDLTLLPEMAMRSIRGKRIGMIFQEPMTSLNPVLTVGQQIGETLQQHMLLDSKLIKARTLELLASVGIPDVERAYEAYPHQLSGGMKQRVMIAIALSCEPDLLIADEPTTALDVTIQSEVLELLKKFQQKNGMAILLITHDLGVVSEMADEVGVMYAGQIVEKAKRHAFFAHPRHPYSQKLFASLPSLGKRGQALEVISGSVPRLDQTFPGCRFVERCPYAMEQCSIAPPQWVEKEDQGYLCYLTDETLPGPKTKKVESDQITPDESAAKPQSFLQITDLKIHFPVTKGLFKRTVGMVKAVDGVSLSIQSHRTLALVGESGCGKTTLGKGILQLIRPTSGEILLDGQDMASMDSKALRAKRHDMQIIFQDPYGSLDPRMVVSDLIEEGMLASRQKKTSSGRQSSIEKLLLEVGLSPDIKRRYPHEFSGGQRQRVAIARALAVNPRLIVGDEPTSALDVSVQAQILNLLKRLQDSLGISYLFITHNISVVEYLAHEVAVMYLGRIVEQGTAEEVLRTPKHPYTKALLSAVPVIEAGSGKSKIRLQGELPSPTHPPNGCYFHPRCPDAMAECLLRYPVAAQFSDTHYACCYLYSTSNDSQKDLKKVGRD